MVAGPALTGPDARSALADGGMLDELKKASAERALNAVLNHHLEDGGPDGRANGWNGYDTKSVMASTVGSICRLRATGWRPSTRS